MAVIVNEFSVQPQTEFGGKQSITLLLINVFLDCHASSGTAMMNYSDLAG